MRNRALRSLQCLLLCAVVLPAIVWGLPQSPDARSASGADFDVLAYIHTTWSSLTRSISDCSSLADSKLSGNTRGDLYYPAEVRLPEELLNLQARCKFHLRPLPRTISHLGQLSPSDLKGHGLLYLPNPYVVPGGRFNEMYGWDSYFIIRGLIEDGRLALARGMVENFFFEIDHYGAVLNANRTYYLTRSQPPFLSSMVLAVSQAEQAAHHDQRAWLNRAYAYVERDYMLWMSGPKFDAATGLSRYYDFGSGPVPEIGDHADYYPKTADWFLRHPGQGAGVITGKKSEGIGAEFLLPLCGSAPCANAQPHWLTPAFYKGDRALRESGFDISFRFGPFGAATDQFAPVCLNSLLYKVETDLASMARQLGRTKEARAWDARALRRKQRMNQYMWDEKLGVFTDYNLRTRQRSSVLYASIFYPLWTGLATAAQAESIVRQLPRLEFPGGLSTSTVETGAQWDKPYGWAPLQLIAIEGMRRYGFAADADRLSSSFLSMVAENARREGTIREKYNVVDRDTGGAITAGYSVNVIGFGWTNGVFVSLLHQLAPEAQRRITAPAAPEKKLVGASCETGSQGETHASQQCYAGQSAAEVPSSHQGCGTGQLEEEAVAR